MRRSAQGGGSIQCSRCQWIERTVNESRFTRAGYAGHAGEQANGKVELDALQVVTGRSLNDQLFLWISLAPSLGDGNALPARQIVAR